MTMLQPDPVFTVTGDMGPIMCLAISPSRDLVYCGTDAGQVHIWSLATMRQIDKFTNGDKGCLSILIQLNKDVIIQEKFGCIRLWSKTDNVWIQKLNVKIDYVGFCQCRQLDSYLLVPMSSSMLKILMLPSGQEVTEMDVSGGETVGEIMSLSPFQKSGENYVVIAAENGKICVCDFKSGKTIGTSLKLEECPMAIDFDSDKMRGIVGTPSTKVIVFKVTVDWAIAIWRTVEIMNDGVATVRIRPDRKLVALGCWDGKLRLLSWKTLVTLAALELHSDTINSVSFSNDMPYLLTAGCKGGRISLWNIYNDKRKN